MGGETDGGVFEIDLDTQQADALDFLFEETSHLGVDPMTQVIFSDGVEPGRPRWHGQTLGGPLESWTIKDMTGGAGDGSPRQGTKAWWSGNQEQSKDSALLSVPIRVPRLGKTVLQFYHRFQLEPDDCVSQGKVHHGARVEWKAEPGGSWDALLPEDLEMRTVFRRRATHSLS